MVSVLGLFAEGTKQLKPSASTTVQGYLNPWDWGGNFASYSSQSDVNSRLNITIHDYTTEQIYFGFNSQYTGNTYVRIKNSSGTVVYGPILLSTTAGSRGRIDTYDQAVAGPRVINSNGYNPMFYQPTANGDFYIELNTDNPNTDVVRNVIYNYFDITVVKNPTTSPVAINGRVWAIKWALTTGSATNIFQPTLYVYRSDGIIYQLVYNDIKPWGFGIVSNSWGLNGMQSINESRKSKATTYTQGNVPYQPEHKIFLNPPDPNAFVYETEIPQVSLTSITSIECDVNGYCINVYADTDGQVELKIDVDGNGFPTPKDVRLNEKITAGTTCIPWDGLDANGMPVANGSQISLEFTYSAGLIHFPIYDAENNTGGFAVNLIAPENIPNVAQFWDDSSIGGTTNLIGCTSSDCHTWTNTNEIFHNTWARSYTYTSTDVFTFSSQCPPNSSNFLVNAFQNTDFFFNGSLIPFVDPNISDVLHHITITSLPIVGSLYLDGNSSGTYNTGEAISLNQQILASNIPKLAFRPVTGQTGSPYTTFSFLVNDGTLNALASNIVTINVITCPTVLGACNISQPTQLTSITTNSGTNFPTIETTSGTGTSWTTGNAGSNNNTYSTVTLTDGAVSNYLNLSGFGINVPQYATINGIEVEISKFSSGKRNIQDNTIQLLDDVTLISQNKAKIGDWLTSEASSIYGGNTELWGQPIGYWTPAKMATLGVRMKVGHSGNHGDAIANIDFVRVTVYYTTSTNYHDNGTYTFTVSPYTNATNYTWTVPSGAAITSGQGTTSMTVNFNDAGFQGNYNICVTPSNSCNSAPQCCVSVPIDDYPNSFEITSHPSAQTECEGEGAGFSVSTSGTVPTYQWKVSTNNGITWSNVSDGILYSGITTSSLGISTIDNSMNGYLYRCEMTSGTQTIISNSGLMTVNVIPSITSTTAAASPICSTATTTLTANGVGGTNTLVTWYSGSGGTGTNYGTGLTLTNRGPGTYYARVTGDCGTPVEALVTVAGITNASVASVRGTALLCIGATTTYAANSVVLGGGTGAWSSSNNTVATVNASGLVTGVANGTCNIIYTITGCCGETASAQQSVTVQQINAIVSDADASSSDCPDFLGPWDANSNSYNPGVSEVKFNVTRENSTTNWKFDYEVSGAAVHATSLNPISGTKSGLTTNSIELVFYITNVPGVQQNVTLTISNISDANCTETNTIDNEEVHTIKAMPVVGSFN